MKANKTSLFDNKKTCLKGGTAPEESQLTMGPVGSYADQPTISYIENTMSMSFDIKLYQARPETT